MNLLKEVLDELWSMFVGDRRLTFLLLASVAIAAVAATAAPAHSVIAPAIPAGVAALAVLADSVRCMPCVQGAAAGRQLTGRWAERSAQGMNFGGIAFASSGDSLVIDFTRIGERKPP